MPLSKTGLIFIVLFSLARAGDITPGTTCSGGSCRCTDGNVSSEVKCTSGETCLKFAVHALICAVALKKDQVCSGSNNLCVCNPKGSFVNSPKQVGLPSCKCSVSQYGSSLCKPQLAEGQLCDSGAGCDCPAKDSTKLVPIGLGASCGSTEVLKQLYLDQKCDDAAGSDCLCGPVRLPGTQTRLEGFYRRIANGATCELMDLTRRARMRALSYRVPPYVINDMSKSWNAKAPANTGEVKMDNKPIAPAKPAEWTLTGLIKSKIWPEKEIKI